MEEGLGGVGVAEEGPRDDRHHQLHRVLQCQRQHRALGPQRAALHGHSVAHDAAHRLLRAHTAAQAPLQEQLVARHVRLGTVGLQRLFQALAQRRSVHRAREAAALLPGLHAAQRRLAVVGGQQREGVLVQCGGQLREEREEHARAEGRAVRGDGQPVHQLHQQRRQDVRRLRLRGEAVGGAEQHLLHEAMREPLQHRQQAR